MPRLEQMIVQLQQEISHNYMIIKSLMIRVKDLEANEISRQERLAINKVKFHKKTYPIDSQGYPF